MKIEIKYHSSIDLITNSSTELFCEITASDEFLNIIQKELSELFQREIKIVDCYDEYNCIQFDIEYGSETQDILTNDYVKLLDVYLTNLVGKNNYKINTDVCY